MHHQMIGSHLLATALWRNKEGIIIFLFYHFYKILTIHVRIYLNKIIQTLFCWRSFPPEAVGEYDSGGPLQGPTGPSLQSLLCLSVQFITTTPQCTLSAEQIHLSPSNHLEQTHCQLLVTKEGNRRGSEGLLDFQKESLACWRLQPPPTVLKITSTSTGCPDRLELWGSIISLQCLFNTQKRHARALFTCKGIPTTVK